MKTLLILRHGKSSWDDPMQRDFDRPLLNKGRLRTQLIADYMAKNQLVPELIVSSPAVRAYDTAIIIAMSIGYKPEQINKNDELYFVDSEKYSEAVFGAPNVVNTLLLVGHNPMITEFCNMFVSPLIDNLPTSGLCAVQLDTDNWSQLHTCSYTNTHLVFPKNLNRE